MSQKADGSVFVRWIFDTKGAEKDISKIKNTATGAASNIGGAFKKLGAVIASAFAVKKIIDFTKACIELGSDLEEVQNVVDVVFGDSAERINQFAKQAATSLGLSELEAKRYASTLGAMYKSMGITGEAVDGMSMKMTELAADMASFYNLDSETAFNKIRSGISGETEPLKQLGINLSEANLEQYRLSQGIQTSYSAMDQQSKAILRYNYLLSVTKDAQGDFARTSGSWANQLRVLKLQLDSIKADLGSGFIAIFTPVIRVINTLLQGIAKLAASFKAFTQLITGKKQEAAGGGAAGQMLAEAADSADDYADATKDVAKETKKAAKETNKYLSGLDEIHTYTEKTSTGSDASSSAPKKTTGKNVSGAVPMPEFNFGKLETGETVVDKLALKMADLYRTIKDGAKPTIQALKNLYDQGLQRLGNFTGGALYDFYSKFLVPVGKWVMGKGLPSMIDALNDGLMKVDFDKIRNSLAGLWEALAPFAVKVGEGLLWFWENVLVKYAVWTANEALPLYLDAFADAVDGASSVLDTAGQAFLDFYNDFLTPVSQWVIGEGLPQFIEITKNGLAKIDFEKIRVALDGVWKALAPFAVNVGKGLLWFYENVLLPLGTWVANEVVPRFLETVGTVLEDLNIIIEAAKPYVLWLWENLLKPIATWTAGLFLTIWDGINKALKIFGQWCKEHPEIVGRIAAAIAGLFAAFKIGGLVAGIGTLIATIGPIPALILGVIAAGIALWQNWDTIKAKGIEIWGKLTSWLGEKWKSITGGISTMWGNLKLWLIKTWGTIGTKARNAFNAIGETIGIAWDAAKTKTSQVWNALKTGVVTVWNGLKNTGISVFNGLKDGIGKAWTAVKTTATSLWEGITSIIKTEWFRIKSGITKKIGEIKAGISEGWEAVKTKASELWDGIKTVVTDTWDALKEGIDEKVGAIQKAVGDAWDAVKKTASEKWEAIKKGVTDIWGGLKTKASTSFGNIRKNINAAWTAVSNKASEIWDGVSSKVTEVWEGIRDSDLYETVKTTISSTWESVSETATEKWDAIKSGVQGAWESIRDSDIYETVKTTMTDTWDNVSTAASEKWGSIKQTVSDVWDAWKTAATSEDSPFAVIRDSASNAWESIKTSASTWWGEGGITGVLTGVWETITSTATSAKETLYDSFGGVFSEICDFIKTPINGIIGAINGMIDGVFGGLNLVIDALNNLSFTIPNWVPKVGGSRFGLDIPRFTSWYNIPLLAKGAVIPPNAPFLAQLGDQKSGTNLEAPESLIRQIMREELGDSVTHIVLNLDGQVVWDKIIQKARRQQMISGSNPFELA